MNKRLPNTLYWISLALLAIVVTVRLITDSPPTVTVYIPITPQSAALFMRKPLVRLELIGVSLKPGIGLAVFIGSEYLGSINAFPDDGKPHNYSLNATGLLLNAGRDGLPVTIQAYTTEGELPSSPFTVERLELVTGD